jgi:hypothetical protein
LEVSRHHPMPRLHGWELKPYAMLHCAFEDVLLLDADNLCYRDPASLFETAEYRSTGAIFWPDVERISPDRAAWKVFGVPYRDEPAFESGQIVLNKPRCWNPLLLTVWYNAHSAYFYEYVYGDKDTFHMAFRRLETPYAMTSRAAERSDLVFTQFDFAGVPLFQHGIKWSLDDGNGRYAGFPFFSECQEYVGELRQKWNGKVGGTVGRSRPILRPAWSFAGR